METIDKSCASTPSAFKNDTHVVSPNNPPWNVPVALLVWLMSVALLAVVPGIILLIYVAPFRRLMAPEALVSFATTDPTALFLQIIAVLPVHLLTLGLCWLVVTRKGTYPFFATLGWRSGGMRWYHHALLIIAVMIMTSAVLRIFPEVENDVTRMVRNSRMAVFALAALAVLTAPLVEEVVYRGVLFSALQRPLGVWAGVAGITLLFAVVHVPQYWPSLSTLFLILMLSFILAVIRAKTGNLFPGFVLHTVFNAIQSLGLLLDPYISAPPADTGQIQTIIANVFNTLLR